MQHVHIARAPQSALHVTASSANAHSPRISGLHDRGHLHVAYCALMPKTNKHQVSASCSHNNDASLNPFPPHGSPVHSRFTRTAPNRLPRAIRPLALVGSGTRFGRRPARIGDLTVRNCTKTPKNQHHGHVRAALMTERERRAWPQPASTSVRMSSARMPAFRRLSPPPVRRRSDANRGQRRSEDSMSAVCLHPQRASMRGNRRE